MGGILCMCASGVWEFSRRRCSLSPRGRKSPPRERVLDVFAYVFYNVMLIAYEIFFILQYISRGGVEKSENCARESKGVE